VKVTLTFAIEVEDDTGHQGDLEVEVDVDGEPATPPTTHSMYRAETPEDLYGTAAFAEDYDPKSLRVLVPVKKNDKWTHALREPTEGEKAIFEAWFEAHSEEVNEAYAQAAEDYLEGQAEAAAEAKYDAMKNGDFDDRY
jgi:hypothetical protein